MKMLRAELYLIDNDPSTTKLLDKLLHYYDGYTAVDGVGAYASYGEVCIDHVVVVTVIIDDHPKSRVLLHKLMQQYRIDAKQQAVLYVLNGNDAIFIKE